MKEKLPKIFFDRRLYEMLNQSSKKHMKILFRNLKMISKKEENSINKDSPIANKVQPVISQDSKIHLNNNSALLSNIENLNEHLDRNIVNNKELYPDDKSFYRQNIANNGYCNGNIQKDKLTNDYKHQNSFPVNLTTNITNYNQITYTNYINTQPNIVNNNTFPNQFESGLNGINYGVNDLYNKNKFKNANNYHVNGFNYHM